MVDNGVDMNLVLCFFGEEKEDWILFKKEGYWYLLSWFKDDCFLVMICYIFIEDS